MASCMLCSSWVLDGEAVCPHCGGATEADPGVQPPGPEGSPWAVPADATAVDPLPPDGALAPTSWGDGPPAIGPPGWGPVGAPPVGGHGYGPPIAPTPAPGPPGYPPPWDAPGWDAAAAHGPPGHPPAGYAAPGYGPPGYGGAPYGAPWYGVPPGPWSPPPATSGLAVTAFVVSLVSVVTALFCYVPILAAPVGAGLGHAALRRIRDTGEGGRGLALAAVILGWIGTGILGLGLVLVIVLVAASGSGGA